MIDIAALSRLTEGGKPFVVFDSTGETVDRDDLFGAASAVLIVSPITDAVKLIAGGLLQESVDRETLWSVEGFAVGREVLLALEGPLITPEGLIEAVTRVGFQWQVISPSSSSS